MLSYRRMLGHVGSESSHTFTGQDPNRWKSILSGAQIEALEVQLRRLSSAWVTTDNCTVLQFIVF